MTERADFSGKDKRKTQEGMPSLRLAVPSASKFGKALENATGGKISKHAVSKSFAKSPGFDDLKAMKDWLNNSENADTPETTKWKMTYNYFPGTVIMSVTDAFEGVITYLDYSIKTNKFTSVQEHYNFKDNEINRKSSRIVSFI